MQDVVHQVFFTVVGIIVTLLTIAITGVVTLLVTDRDTAHSDPARPA